MQDVMKSPALGTRSGSRALLVAVVAGLGCAALVAVYLQRFEHETSGGEPVTILRARKPIERGALITEDALVETTVPAGYLESRAVRANERNKVIGIRAANTLDTQDGLLWSDLAIAQEDRDLSSLIQPGNRAVTVQASAGFDPESAELIRPGDYVDVIATMAKQGASKEEIASIVLLQRILVLAIGTDTESQAFRASETDKAGARAPQMMTLSLKVEEAQLLGLARERGTLSVILRSVNDMRILESAPDIPVSSLFDPTFRNDLQRRRSGPNSTRPVKIAATPATGSRQP